MRLYEVMSTRVKTAEGTEDAEAALFRMKQDGIHHLVAMRGAEVEGVLSSEDLGGPHGEAVRRGKTVADLMIRSPLVADSRTSIRTAANLLRGRSIGCLPVVDDGQLSGIVTVSDICAWVGRGVTRTQRVSTTRAGRRYASKSASTKLRTL
ncbi:MAG: CBS domain-containing protein [Myxococcaceae bacterium]